MTGPRPPARAGAVAVIGLLLLCACSATPSDATTTAPTPPGTDAATATDSTSDSPPTPDDDEERMMNTLHLTTGGRVVVIDLDDSTTALDLASRTPLTLAFSDLNGVEKVATLPAPLTMDGMPAGDDPEPNDLGYYAPTQSLVLYYGDVGYWNGIVRIGRIVEDDMSHLQDLPDGFGASLTRP